MPLRVLKTRYLNAEKLNCMACTLQRNCMRLVAFLKCIRLCLKRSKKLRTSYRRFTEFSAKNYVEIKRKTQIQNLENATECE